MNSSAPSTVGRAAVHEHAAEEAFDSVAAAQHGDTVAQVVNRLGREQVLDQSSNHGLRRLIEEIPDVRGDARHLPVGG